MTIEQIEDGGICSVCGLPIFFHGEATVDCPQCGTEYVNSEVDNAE
ncbi:MAG: hypothetical protein HQ454_03015 [Acidimicrobiaceae bacterium]|nr:hypothetical protein [Acidimicrobiaceae bacterium]